MIWSYLFLIPLGFVIGAYATLIGAGGGFVLVPVLLLLYPKESPETITSISLAVVFFSALSGSIAYARTKRIEYRSALILSAGSIPGSILGVLTTPLIARRTFDIIFALLMLVAAAILLFSPSKKRQAPSSHLGQPEDYPNHAHDTRRYNTILGTALGLFVGYISGLLGIGGGFIEVPAMVYALNFPIHIATATSQFIQVILALTGSATHVATGMFHHGIRRTVALAIGVILGAQLGAKLSGHLHGDWIIRSLAMALAFVGLRLIVMAF